MSNKGRVFTKNKKYFGYIMIPVETKDGYLRIQITIDGKKKDKYIHDLVAESFVYKPYPIPLKGYHVHHKDKQKKNCDSENLCYLTPQQHKKLHDNEYKFISEEE